MVPESLREGPKFYFLTTVRAERSLASLFKEVTVFKVTRQPIRAKLISGPICFPIFILGPICFPILGRRPETYFLAHHLRIDEIVTTVRAEIITELFLKRAGPVIFKTFLLELIVFRPIPVICPARGVKPENYWKR